MESRMVLHLEPRNGIASSDCHIITHETNQVPKCFRADDMTLSQCHSREPGLDITLIYNIPVPDEQCSLNALSQWATLQWATLQWAIIIVGTLQWGTLQWAITTVGDHYSGRSL